MSLSLFIGFWFGFLEFLRSLDNFRFFNFFESWVQKLIFYPGISRENFLNRKNSRLEILEGK